jgi:MoxR-like ATPase
VSGPPTDLGYQPLFLPDTPPAQQPFDATRAFALGDRREIGAAVRYVFDAPLALAVNVALATGRPLLLRGHPGTGKTSLARSVAAQLGWRFYGTTVSSRTTARDLQWGYDAVGRLAEADAEADPAWKRPRAAFVTPGPLWWAFDRDLARRRGLTQRDFDAADGRVTAAPDPSAEVEHERAVVLIDEIDKADPDVPNDLLVPLGSLQFQVDDGPLVAAKQPPLVVITTNEERDLPRAFVRRCVVHTLEQPTPTRLREIAEAHAGTTFNAELFDAVVAEYVAVRQRRIDANEAPPSVAELLDVLNACRNLDTATTRSVWSDLARVLLDKATAIPPERATGDDP